jgi:hypothetical protein
MRSPAVTLDRLDSQNDPLKAGPHPDFDGEFCRVNAESLEQIRRPSRA